MQDSIVDVGKNRHTLNHGTEGDEAHEARLWHQLQCLAYRRPQVLSAPTAKAQRSADSQRSDVQLSDLMQRTISTGAP